MTTKAIADRLVNLCREGKWEQCYEELFDQNASSIEPEESDWPSANSLNEILAKAAEWSKRVIEVHNLEISDPLVAEDHFACVMKSDVTLELLGRNSMEEICIYTVKEGKIVKEQFYYSQ